MTGYKFSNKKVKENNLRLVLMEILQNSPISRIEISKKTGLTRSTVSELVKRLMEEGLIKESCKNIDKAGPGKKPILLIPETEKFFVIGYDLTVIHSEIVVMNLNGDVIMKKPFISLKKIMSLKNITEILNLFIKSLDEIKHDLNITSDSIKGIGVAFPGLVSRNNNSLSITPNLERYFDFSLIDKFSEKLQIPIVVDNNANMKALGELIYGIGKEVHDFLLVNISYGIGAGLVIQNQLFRGKYNLSGEIGHIKVAEDGDICSCGEKGCLETFSSVRSMVRKYYTKCNKKLDESYDIGKIIDYANQGDQNAIQIFQESGFYLGKAIGNVLNIVNVESVVLTGEVKKYWDIIEKDFYKGLNETTLPLIEKNTQIRLSGLGEEITAIGAASMVLENMLI